jgi:PAS domain S-box-containing protein
LSEKIKNSNHGKNRVRSRNGNHSQKEEEIMPNLLSTLIIQNPRTDTSLLLGHLQEAGFILDLQMVQTESEYVAQLDRRWDLILLLWQRVEPLTSEDSADQDPPLTLDPLRALEILRQKNYQIPLIIISDHPSVELAVNCMKQGAADYLLTEQVTQLGEKVQQLWQRQSSSPYLFTRGDSAMSGGQRLTTVRKIGDRQIGDRPEFVPELFFQDLVETNTDLIWQVDHNAVYTYISPNSKNILGYEPEELIGKTPFDFMSPADALRVAEVWGALAGKLLPFNCLEHRNRHKNGQEIMLESSGIPLLETQEKAEKKQVMLRGYRGISRDVNCRFSQEEAINNLIRETASVTGESFFSSFVRHLAVALGVNYVFVSELSDKNPPTLKIIAGWPEHKSGSKEDNFEYHLTNSPCEITLKQGEYYCPDGLLELFPHHQKIQEMGVCSYLGIRLLNPAGNAIGNLGIFHDRPILLNRRKKFILNSFVLRTEAEMQRQKAEKERLEVLAAVRKNEEKYRSIFAASPVGMATFHLETLTWITANPKFCQMLGYQETEIKKLTVEDITHPEDLAKELRELRRLKTGERSRYKLEKRYLKKSGEIFCCDLNCTAIRDGEEKPLLGLAIVQDITEWKQIEECLRLRDRGALRMQYRALTASNNGIVICDARYPNLPIIYVNPAFEKMTGYLASDILGESCWWLQENQGNHPEWLHSPPPPQLQAAVREAKPCSVVLQNYRPDGTIFWNQLSISPIYDTEKNLSHFLSIHHDITEIEEAQSFLRLSQERLRYLVASNPAVIYSRKAADKYNLTFMSENVLALFGYAASDFLTDANFWANHIHPEDIQVISIASARLLDKESEVQEYRFLHANGHYIWVRDEQKLIRDEQNRPLEIIGYWADISDRKQAEAALQVAKDKLQAFWDAVPGFVSLISSDLKYIGVNQQLADVYGLPPEEFIGQQIGFLNTSGEFSQFITEFFASQQEEATKEVTSGINQNEKTYLMVVKKYQQGTAAVLIGIDITERKQAEDKIQASLREKEVLLKEIHHRVKNNLQVISSLLKMQSRSINDPEIMEIFQESQSRIHSMALIHEKLYQSADLARINCGEYIQNLTSHLYRCYGMTPRHIQLEVKVPQISLSLDAALPCGLIINELVSNALKYAFPDKRSGKISIKLDINVKNCYILKISDNGIGLPKNIDWENTRSLGLRLVRTLSQQLGATVELDLSHGTQFCLTFTETKYQKRI